MLVPQPVRGCSLQVHTAVRKIGKPAGQQLVAMSSAGLQGSRLFYVTDRSTRLKYLVDTGAEVSAVPWSRAQQKYHCQGPSLQAVSNTTIAT